MKIKLAALLLCLGGFASASECVDETYKGNSFTKCTVDVAAVELSLFLYKPNGKPYGQFTTLDRALIAQGKKLAFAMNAGMYHEDRAPVGHFVQDGVQAMRIVPNAGPGNFGLLPNGVLCINDADARVYETLQFVEDAPAHTPHNLAPCW